MIPVDVISQYKKFITIDELRNMGYSYYMTDKLVKAGMLSRMNRTTYENLAYKGDENDFFSAEAFVPGGVVCLMSAARYYELTDYLEDGVDVAIQRKKRVSTLPQWPNLKIYYFDSQRMESGVTEIRDGDNSFHIFDIEKTVVDIISYRNRIGIEETAGVLRNYLKRRDRQIDKLYAYAELLRSEKILRTYCEVLL